MVSRERFMEEALRLASRGRDGVSPNPMVGAVVVRRGKVVGRGYHRRLGGPHAEVVALDDAGPGARKADLYVTLEPCAHEGKTPPCSDAILRSGVARVFFAVADPNPVTRGRGPTILRRRGVRVFRGLLSRPARELNRAYFYRHVTGRPWVILKWAMTLDGKIATRTGESKWITGEKARTHAHRIRRRADAVLVGTRTLLQDNPSLLPRPARGRVPARIILDRTGRLPLSLGILKSGGLGRRIYATTARASARRLGKLKERGLEVLVLPEQKGRIPLGKLLDRLGRAGVGQLLVEGGGSLIGSFLDARLAQEVAAYVAPRVVGGEGARGPVEGKGFPRLVDAPGLTDVSVRRLGEDLLVEGVFGPSFMDLEG